MHTYLVFRTLPHNLRFRLVLIDTRLPPLDILEAESAVHARNIVAERYTAGRTLHLAAIPTD